MDLGQTSTSARTVTTHGVVFDAVLRLVVGHAFDPKPGRGRGGLPRLRAFAHPRTAGPGIVQEENSILPKPRLWCLWPWP